MPWLDGADLTATEIPSDGYNINKDGITASKKFLVSGPPMTVGSAEIDNTLLEVLRISSIPKIGDKYHDSAGAPVCVNVRVSEVENADNKVYRLYSVECDYEINIGSDDLPIIKWNGTDNYEISLTDERVFFEPQEDTVHIDSSKTYASYGDGEPTTLIGVDEDGSVAGVDIKDFSSVLVVERFFKLSDVNFSQIQDSLGKVNSLAFYDRAIGECLFVGATEIGRTRPVDLGLTEDEPILKMSFKFLVGKNLVDTDLPLFKKDDNFTTFNITAGKKAWEYLWVKNRTKGLDATSGTFTYTELAQVHEIYEEVNFANQLGISGSFPE